MSVLNVSPALLVELDRVGFATNLFASLLAVFVVVDPTYSGPRRTRRARVGSSLHYAALALDFPQLCMLRRIHINLWSAVIGS